MINSTNPVQNTQICRYYRETDQTKRKADNSHTNHSNVIPNNNQEL